VAHASNLEKLPVKKASRAAPRSVSQPSRRFGAAYFRKFYLDPATRVVTASEMRNRAALIAALLTHLQIPIRSILDAGCGIGLLRRPFAQVLPRARYTGLELSEYLCRRYGWRQGSVVDLTPRASRSIFWCATTCCSISTMRKRRAPSPTWRGSPAPRCTYRR
jgi:hypothetical protein